MRRESSLAAGLFTVSALSLLVEVVQTRVFSYSLHPLIAYSAIALAMLGFGLGAAILTLRPSLSQGDPQRRLVYLSLALGVSILLVHISFAWTSPKVIPVQTMWVSPGWTALTLLPCILPYLIAGLITAIILQSGLARVGRLLFFNLTGSALGCALVMALLRPLGAERLVALAALAAFFAAFLFALPLKDRLRHVSAIASLSLLFALPFASRWIPFQPDSNDLLYIYAAKNSTQLEREFSQWDPVGRIEVLRHEIPHVHVTDEVDYRTITNDSGAMALLLQAGEPDWGKAIFEESIYSLPYRLKKKPEVLVIGVGGGIDVHAALHWGANRVTGVEVSSSTLHILQGPYAHFTRWKEQGELVQLVHADGRAFARSTQQRFDIVQMSGVDTFTMHSASAMVTAEDYLYTIDAFVDFIGLLHDDGVLAVTRFGDEAMNLSSLAAAALRKLGIRHPQDHIFAAQQGDASGIVFKKTPFSPEEIAILQKVGERLEPNGVKIPHYDEVGLRARDPVRVLHPAMGPPDPRYVSFFSQMAEGRELAALRKMNNPFIPPTDDRPYYMLLGIWMAASKTIHPVVGTLRVATLIIAATSLLLIVAPLLVVRRRSKVGFVSLGAVILYFFGLGAGFMLLEVGLIHRTLVFVGSPAASVSVVMTAILLSSGMGAYVSDRVGWSLAKKLLFALIGMLLVGWTFRIVASWIFDSMFYLPTWARWFMAAAAIAPGGFFAGWFFPTGLRILGNRSETLVPWAIAINGFASVLGSLATLSLGVSFGFSTVFLIALTAYVVAVLALIPMALHSKS